MDFCSSFRHVGQSEKLNVSKNILIPIVYAGPPFLVQPYAFLIEQYYKHANAKRRSSISTGLSEDKLYYVNT